MRGRWAQELGWIALALAVWMAPVRGVAQEESEATPRIYRWIDENGIAHYTTDPKRIPRPLRSRVGEIEPRSLERPDLEAHAPAPPPPPPPSAVTPPLEAASPDAGSAAEEAAESDPAATQPEALADGEGPPKTEAPPELASPEPETEEMAPEPEVVGSLEPALEPDPWAPEPAAPPVRRRPRPAPPPPPDSWATLDRPPGGGQGAPRGESLQAQIDELDLRIAVLRADIAADEERLKNAISDAEVGPLDQGDDPAFQEVARRLPRRLAELRELREERAKLDPE